MLNLRNLILATFMAGAFAFNANTSLADLPSEIRGELLSMLNGTLHLFGRCTPPENTPVSFFLYTRNNTLKPIVLDPANPIEIDSKKKIVVLAHGWQSGATAQGMVKLKRAYLQRYDCNLIIIDWSKVSNQLYTSAYCQLTHVARMGADFLCQLNKQFNVELSDVHVLGHSLGAHLAGYMGEYVQNMCEQKLGRITGMDPAGPLYEGTRTNQRLDATDAWYVDVVHTHSLVFGYFGNIGHVDYYVNCGYILQPGCPVVNVVDIVNVVMGILTCSHSRSMDIMAETVLSNQLLAKSCDLCPGLCMADILNSKIVSMGEDYVSNATVQTFWVPTKDSSPFAMGCAPYPWDCPEIE